MKITDYDIRDWFLGRARPEVKKAIDADLASQGPISKRLVRSPKTHPGLAWLDDLVEADLATNAMAAPTAVADHNLDQSAAEPMTDASHFPASPPPQTTDGSDPLLDIRTSPDDGPFRLRPDSDRPDSRSPWRSGVIPWAVAASVLIMVFAGGVWWKLNNGGRPVVVKTTPQTAPTGTERKPPEPLSPPEDHRQGKSLIAMGPTSKKSDTPKTPKPPEPAPPRLVKDEEKTLLLAQIAEMNEQFPPAIPLNVAGKDVRELSERIVQYQEEHPEPEIPAMVAFVARAEATPEHEVLYAGHRAKALSGKPESDPEVQDLGKYAASLNDDLIAGNPELKAWVLKNPLGTPAGVQKALRVELAGLAKQSPVALQPLKGRPYLLCLLPPGLRNEALDVHSRVRQFALTHPELSDASLEGFLMRARRPVASDAIGIIAPTIDINHFFLNSVDPDRNVIGRANWGRIVAAGNPYVPIIAVVNLVMDRDALAQLGQKPDTTSAEYYAMITQAKLRNVHMTGYVNCANGTKPLMNIGDEIDSWFRLYDNLSGIFLYNAPSGQGGSKYITDIYRYITMNYGNVIVVSSSNGLPAEDLVNNTGSNLIACMNTGGVAAAFKPPGWMGKYAPARFGAWLRGSPDTLAASIELAAEKHLGWVYVGEVQGPLPELSAEVPLIQEMNARIMGGKVAVGSAGKVQKKGTKKVK